MLWSLRDSPVWFKLSLSRMYNCIYSSFADKTVSTSRFRNIKFSNEFKSCVYDVCGVPLMKIERVLKINGFETSHERCFCPLQIPSIIPAGIQCPKCPFIVFTAQALLDHNEMFGCIQQYLG